MANYPTSAPSFTTKTNGQTIDASHINAIQDEVTAIGTALETSLAHNVRLALTKFFASNGRATGDGVWTTATFAAGDFTANAGNWTVIAGNVINMRYTVVGNMMTVLIDLRSTNVTAGPTQLIMKIPGGFSSVNNVSALMQVSDAGAVGANPGVAQAAGTSITFFRTTAGAAWTLTAGSNTDIKGQMSFEVS